jgi:hypothetical protein
MQYGTLEYVDPVPFLHTKSFILCSVEIINVEDNRASGGSDNGKSRDYIHPSNMEVMGY